MRIAAIQFHTGSIRWYNRFVPVVRNSPPESPSTLTSCRAAGSVLLALPTSFQVRQLESVVEDSHRVSHDPAKVVYDAQEAVGIYHLILLWLRAYCPESARRCTRRAVFARREARYTPRKPELSLARLSLPSFASVRYACSLSFFPVANFSVKAKKRCGLCSSTCGLKNAGSYTASGFP